MVRSREQRDMWSTMVSLIPMLLENTMVGLGNSVKSLEECVIIYRVAFRSCTWVLLT